MQTSYEFTLPRGYVDHNGRLQRSGTMRLATARDELEPLRHPTVSGPDDPRLTILVLARVVETLGDLMMVTEHEIENMFAVDLAFLQDFYGVINFGSQSEFDALVAAQAQSMLVGEERPAPAVSPTVVEDSPAPADVDAEPPVVVQRPTRSSVEYAPRKTG